jgi:hypothetical protein
MRFRGFLLGIRSAGGRAFCLHNGRHLVTGRLCIDDLPARRAFGILKINNHQPQAMHYNIPKMQIHTLDSDVAGTGIWSCCETTEPAQCDSG